MYVVQSFLLCISMLIFTSCVQVVVIQICYLGARGEGEKFLQTLMSWQGERCLLKDVETRTFMEQQDSVKQVLGVQCKGPFP